MELSKHGGKRARRTRLLLLLLLLAFQCVALVYWEGQKQNLFVDEYYSMADARAYMVRGGKQPYFQAQKEWKPECWVPARTFRDQLIVTEETSVLRLPVSEQLRRFFTMRNYMGLLNLVAGLVSPGQLSLMPGFLINLVSFLPTQLLLFGMLRRKGTGTAICLICLLLFGSAASTIAMGIITRFYMFTGLLWTGVLFLHGEMLETKKPGKFLLYGCAAALLAVLGMRNSELLFILMPLLAVCFLPALLVLRRRRFALWYLSAVTLCGLYFAGRYRHLPAALLAHGAAARSWGGFGILGEGGRETILPEAAGRLRWYLAVIWRQLFGHSRPCALACFLLLFLAACCLAVSLVRGEVRRDRGETGSAAAGLFAAVLAASAAGYILFTLVTGMTLRRYWFFPQIQWVAALGLAAGCLFRAVHGRAFRRAALTALAALSVSCAFQPVHEPWMIEYMYRDDRGAVECLKQYAGTDRLYVTSEFPLSNALYECVGLSGDGAELCAVSPDHFRVPDAGSRDTLLLWVNRSDSPERYIPELEAAGYEVRQLTETHTSAVCLAERKPLQ